MEPQDRTPRRLATVFFGVVALLACFYGVLANNALGWSPMFYIRNSDSPRSRIEREPVSIPRAAAGAAERGREIYGRAGCALCHGPEGAGGIANPNSINDTFPRLDLLAERLSLEGPEDAAALTAALERGTADRDTLDIPRAGTVLAQLDSFRTLILNGNAGGKKDSAGPLPIDMPGWKERLTSREIQDILIYLIGRYPWQPEGR